MNSPAILDPLSYVPHLDYLSIAKSIDQRKKQIRANIIQSGYCFNDGEQASSDLVDGYHGEMHFGADPSSVEALNQAWQHVIQEEQKHYIHHNKKQPDDLRALTVNFLFKRLINPNIEGVEGLSLTIDDAVVIPYSSTQLIIHALNARPKKHLTKILMPEGFYKGSAKLAAAAGMTIQTFPVNLHQDGVIIPEILDQYLAHHHQDIALLWLTMPGNPFIANHSIEQLEAIANIIVKYDLDVLIDTAFDKLLPKSAYTPLQNIRVQDQHGRWQSMHEHTFSLTGNSKGLGASGPWKLGAGVCGNKQWLQETIDTVTTVMFQRETTHLIYSGLSAVSASYLEANQQTLKELQLNTKHHIQKLNQDLGEEALIIYGNPAYTPFLCLGLSDNFLSKTELSDSWQLADFLLAGAGIESVELDLVGIRQTGVRLNVTSPRINGHKSPDYIYPLLNRLKFLLQDVQQGLTYTKALERIGITEKVGLDTII